MYLIQDLLHDLVHGRLLPVARIGGPQADLTALVPADLQHPRIVVAARRAHQPGSDADPLVDEAPHAAHFLARLLGADRVEALVIPGVVGNFVPLGRHPVQQRRVLLQPDTDRKKGGAHAFLLQHIQDRRAGAGVGTVVEGQGDGAVVRIPPAQHDHPGAASHPPRPRALHFLGDSSRLEHHPVHAARGGGQDHGAGHHQDQMGPPGSHGADESIEG